MSKSRPRAGTAHVVAGISTAIGTSPAARVTIVVSLREGHGLAIATLENLLAFTPAGIPLHYLDIGSPPQVRTHLERRAGERGFALHRFEGPIWPTAARAAVLDRIRTEYVLFIDNDIVVAPGWLDALLRCADETGAGLVGPIYLDSGGSEPVMVHMAGGDIERRRTETGDAIFERHRLMHAPLSEARNYNRQTCDFVEYHCVLARREIFDRGVQLHRGFGCIHEHIDLALQVQAIGLPIYIEPQAKVMELRDGDYLLSDLPLLRWRWAEDSVDASIDAFCRLWNVVPDEEAFRGVRIFSRDRRRQIDPVRRDLSPAPDDKPPSDNDGIARNRAALISQMERAGYSGDDRWQVMKACNLATEFHHNGYRAGGQPFLEHAVGVASLLAQWRTSYAVIATGLLHTAFTHGRISDDRPPDLDLLSVRIREQCGSQIEKQVRNVTRMLADPQSWLARHRHIDALPLSAAVTAMIATADMIDELQDDCPNGGKESTAAIEWQAMLDSLAPELDLPALATAWRRATTERPISWAALRDRRSRAYRLSNPGAERSPLENNWFGAWLRQPVSYRGRAASPIAVVDDAARPERAIGQR
jgi:hypothetical protein